MFNFSHDAILSMLYGIPAIIIAMVIHEYAHALVADYFGDDTPRLMGRLTLNPLVHIDIFGFIMLFIAQIGWARPVMINPNNFRDIRKAEVLVALAGPLSNLLLAFISLLVMYSFAAFNYSLSTTAQRVLSLMVLYNINFAIFNILPIPPLDGSRIITAFLSDDWQAKLASIEKYNIILFIILINLPIFHIYFFQVQRLLLGLMKIIITPIFNAIIY